MKTNNKLIVILGPTASGKTGLSVKLAKKFHGEIISADSRQVYRGMDITTAKITPPQMKGIPHYLLDVANPKRRFSIAEYQKLALRAIQKVSHKKKVPFLVGGTGFYIQSIVDGIVIPSVPPNWKLRKELEKKTAARLFLLLQKLDPVRAASIDQKNPRRLVRAIEIVRATKKPVPELKKQARFDVLQIGIRKSPQELKKAVAKRISKRLKIGMVAEVKKLQRGGVSYKRIEEFGLEHRNIALYLQNKITREQMVAGIQKETEQFAKRQMTWFKRDKKIHWITSQKQAESLIKKFLKQKPFGLGFVN